MNTFLAWCILILVNAMPFMSVNVGVGNHFCLLTLTIFSFGSVIKENAQ